MLIRVFTAEHISEAGLIRSYLEENNISSQLRNEYSSSVMGELPFMTSSPELWVESSLASRAKELIQQLNAPQESTQDWVCADCSESNPGNFASCWSCQTIRA